MKRILVLGGTRFFGKKLVQLLLEDGHRVTIATRGKTPNPFGEKVEQLLIDRTNKAALKKAVADREWDIVYDNICYSSNEAFAACEIFRGKTKKYVFTSTLSTYEVNGKVKTEEDFDPYTYEVRMGDIVDFTYGEGKRQAEAVFFRYAEFPVVAVRFPIVLGEDDYTKRLHFHIKRVATGEVISFVNMDARMSYILSDDAASFLKFAGLSTIEGPYNATSTGTYSLQELMDMIEKAVGKRAKIALGGDNTSLSPFAVPTSWYMSQAKSIEAGFSCSALEDWLPSLIEQIAQDTID